MKRFDFPLERVRAWRKTQVDLEQARLQVLYVRLQGIENERHTLDREETEAAEACHVMASVGEAINTEGLRELDLFRAYVRRALAALAARRLELEEEIARQQKKLVEARRNCQLLDRLKEKARAEWDRAYARELETSASELFLARWTGADSQSERDPPGADHASASAGETRR